MSYTNLGICSKALLKIGANTITSFEEGTAEAEVSVNLYPMIRDGLISSYPWSFAIAQKKLPQLEQKPMADYKYAYLLPNDYLRTISAGVNNKGSGLEYRIHENQLHTNLQEIIMTYIFRPEENTFPAFFVEALISKLAAEFCLPLTESTSRADYLLKKSEEEIKRARLTDAQQATPKKFEDFSLVEARL